MQTIINLMLCAAIFALIRKVARVEARVVALEPCREGLHGGLHRWTSRGVCANCGVKR